MKASFLTLFSAALALAGCSSSEPSDSASSAGVNSVTRRYAKPASDVYDAALSTVKSYDLTVDSDRHDNMGGELVAHLIDHVIEARLARAVELGIELRRSGAEPLELAGDLVERIAGAEQRDARRHARHRRALAQRLGEPARRCGQRRHLPPEHPPSLILAPSRLR